MMLQVYMPFEDPALNIKVLHEDMVVSQCNVATTILKTLKGNSKGWEWHPGVRMWSGNEEYLAQYIYRLVRECTRTFDFPDLYSIHVLALGYPKRSMMPEPPPWWMGDKRYHLGVMAQMIRQNPDWYGRIFKAVDPKTEQMWPLPEVDKFTKGPFNGHVYMASRSMEDRDFIEHANKFHNLSPDIKGGIRKNENPQLLSLLRALHDRFHIQRVYNSHDHS